jgi:hypothetical protein
VVVVLWLLNAFGVLGHLHDVRISNLKPSIGYSSSSVVLQS